MCVVMGGTVYTVGRHACVCACVRVRVHSIQVLGQYIRIHLYVHIYVHTVYIYTVCTYIHITHWQ